MVVELLSEIQPSHVSGYPLTTTGKCRALTPQSSCLRTNLYRLLGGTLEAADELERERRELSAYLTHEHLRLARYSYLGENM